MGGLSNIYQEDVDEEDESYIHRKAYWNTRVGVVGFNHTIPLSNNIFVKTSVSFSGNGSGGWYEMRNDQGEFYKAADEDNSNEWIRASTSLNYKINAKHRIKSGITYTSIGYQMFSEYDFIGEGNYIRELDSKGNSALIQAYGNWKYRILEDLTMVTGAHYTYFALNDNFTIEPRMGVTYKSSPKSSFSLGVGMHSKVESLATYTSIIEDENGKSSMPNKNLGMTKAIHFVGGYQYNFNKNLRLKTELYYQHLYDVPGENNPNSVFVYGNQMGGWTNNELTNNSTGRNYGLELTLERFYNKGFYYLLTGSVYDSKFTSPDGVERNSAFNGHFAGNVLVGKEFSCRKILKKPNHCFECEDYDIRRRILYTNSAG